ncbi:MAG: hypothetical protein GXP29_09405 [Planctomycetes bacterium]|nr:hypothetical protein [Planctomycetota bacterium]
MGSLAFAMAGGAGILFWLEPDADSAAFAAHSHRPSLAARQAVATCAIFSENWQVLTIIPVDSRQESRSLVAVGPREDLHFVVSKEGVVAAQNAWRSQQQFGGDASIRVGVTVASGEHGIGDHQFEGLRALWEALNNSVAHSGDSIPLDLHFVHADQQKKLRDTIADALPEPGQLEARVEG